MNPRVFITNFPLLTFQYPIHVGPQRTLYLRSPPSLQVYMYKIVYKTVNFIQPLGVVDNLIRENSVWRVMVLLRLIQSGRTRNVQWRKQQLSNLDKMISENFDQIKEFNYTTRSTTPPPPPTPPRYIQFSHFLVKKPEREKVRKIK